MNETTLVAILFLCPLLDAGAMAFVLFFPWEKVIESETLEGKEPCITVPRLFLGLLAAGGVFVFKLPLLIVLGLDGFGLIHVTYLDLVGRRRRIRRNVKRGTSFLNLEGQFSCDMEGHVLHVCLVNVASART